MLSELISNKQHLFYYSFRQVRTTDIGREETRVANKILIRKNDDFCNEGLQFIIHNFDQEGNECPYDEIMKTKIEMDSTERIDFYGKGKDSDRIGVLLYKKDKPELAFAKSNERNIIWYLNFYSGYNDDVFEISRQSVVEFISSTSQQMHNVPYNPLQNTWQAIRAFVLSYYSKLYHMNINSFPHVTIEEWDKKDIAVDLIDNINLLTQIERTCDERMLEAHKERQRGNELLFKQKMEKMVDLIGTYYILYRTIL